MQDARDLDTPSHRDFSLTRPTAEPLYFSSADRTLFGWLDWPSNDRYGDVGVVVCKPFGYEAMCAHKGLRAFAEACAALGAPTLRFDYAGTGDSSDIDPAADQIQIWTLDVVSAVRALQERTGVRRVCLLGVRLGALLAALARGRCPAVQSMALIAPIVSGRRYLKDLHVTRLAAGLSQAGPPPALTENGSMEISGFHLSQASIASLQQAALETSNTSALAATLIIDAASLPVARHWSEQLAATGAPVVYQALPGLVEMAFTAPQFATVPQLMLATVGNWFTQTVLGAAPERPFSRPDSSAEPTLSVLDDPGQQASLTERPVFIGPDAAVFGIVTEPRAGERRRRAVLLLNAGADVHTGPSGISVALARTWARRGYVVLRMDFAGIGDSRTPPGRAENAVFPAAAIDDMRAAIEFLRTRYDTREVTLAGMCSGAYHTLQSAIAELPVDRLLMINPQNFHWNQRMSIHGMQVAELVARPSGNPVTARLASIKWWRRLFTGQLDIAYVAKLQVRRVGFYIASALKNIARLLGIRLPDDLGRQLELIARRGIRIVLVFARGEPGIDLLRLQAGASLDRLGGCFRMYIIDGADHVFSKLGPRRQLEQILSEELYRLSPAREADGRLPDPVTLRART